MKQTLIITCELPDLNSIIQSSKISPYKYAKSKKGYDSIVSAFAKEKLKPITKYPVDIYCHWVVKNKKKDPDGISAGTKFLLDGLVKAGILSNDNFAAINSIHHSFEVDSINPRIEVILSY